MELYDDLYDECKLQTQELDSDHKSTIVQHIKHNKDIHDNIYKLIKLYELQKKDKDLYKSRMLKSGGVRVNINHLPVPLQHMIYSFCTKRKNIVF